MNKKPVNDCLLLFVAINEGVGGSRPWSQAETFAFLTRFTGELMRLVDRYVIQMMGKN